MINFYGRMEINPKSTNQFIRIVVLLILLFILWLLPFDVLSDSESVCIHYHLLGFQCPLCGMTRAVHLFLHFHFLSAIQHNILVLFLPFYLLADILSLILKYEWLCRLKKILLLLLAVAFVVLYVFRMAKHFAWF
jgi:hypothetical protein